MAVNVSAAGNKIEWGSSGPFAGVTAGTWCFTIKIASTLTGARFLGQWDGADAGQHFLCSLINTDEVNFVVSDGDGQQRRGDKTTGLNLAANTLYRMAFRWRASDQAIDIFVNGQQETDTASFGGTPAGLNGTAPVAIFLGRESEENQAGVQGDYSEYGFWDAFLPDASMLALSNGVSPIALGHPNLQWWCPLWSTSYIDNYASNAAGKQTGAATGMTSAVHPAVHYPRHLRVLTAPAAAGGGGRIMSSLANHGGLAGQGGIAGKGGGLAA